MKSINKAVFAASYLWATASAASNATANGTASASGNSTTASSSSSSASSMPIVDLGYELHQAFAYNVSRTARLALQLMTNAWQATGDYYSFINIRYAAPPTGDLRFRAPQAPASNRSVVQTGASNVVCPQTIPDWILAGEDFVTKYTNGQRVFNTSSLPSVNTSASGLLANTPGESEDCVSTSPSSVDALRLTGLALPRRCCPQSTL